MTDSFGIGDGNFEDSALVASRWTSGGNSAAARRARVKAQRRDKYGRWAEMGGGVSFPGRMADGSIKTVIGRYIGPSARDGYMRVEVTDPKSGVKLGVYDVNGKVATVSKAILTGEQLEEAGIKLDVNGNRVGETLDRDIEDFDQMFDGAKPDEVEAHLVNKGLSDDEKAEEEKARLNATPHVSYNVVDENGNPIAEAPEKPQARIPEQVTKNPSESMTLFNRADGSIHPIQVVKNDNGRNWLLVEFKPEDGTREVLGTYGDREEAENDALAKITGGDAKARIEPQPEPAPESKVVVPQDAPEVAQPSAVTPATQRISRELFPTREGQIDRSQLTAEQIKALDNLIKYKDDAVASLATAALGKGPEEYKTQYALVERISESINALADNAALGKAGDTFFFSGNQEARVENLRIIPSSIKTAIATDPKLPPNTSVITEAKGIIISKTGKPYLLTYKDGAGSRLYAVSNGTIDESRSVGSCSASSMLTGGAYRDNREPHKPNDASIGMISVDDRLKQDGLGGYLILMNRFVAQKHGRRFAHSNNLLPPGNVYSKHVSKHLEDQHRYQRDKALAVQAPNAPIIGVLKSISRELGYSATQWADDKEVIRRGLRSASNQSALWDIGQEINDLADNFRARFKDDKNAQPGVDYPAIFERHVKSENPDWTNHDFQMQVLRTAYQEGLSKDEIVAKLGEYIALGDNNPWGLKLSAGNVRKITALRDAISASNWDNYNPVPEPKPLDADKVKYWDSPFAGQQKFNGFVVPKDMTPVRVGPDYVHRPDAFAPAGSPQDWTENPTELATRFSADELVAALRTSVLAKTNNVSLKFGGDQEGVVNSAAVYRALTEQGQDAPKILAGIYDEALGEGKTDNIDALTKHRANLRDINDDFSEILKQYGIERPVEFQKVNGRFNESSGTLFADMVRRLPADEEASTNLRVRPLRASNERRMLLNNIELNSSAYAPTKRAEDWVVNGVTDNPKILAYNFSSEALTNALSSAVVNGRRHVNVQFANNQTINMPVEAIRDALQHQGIDTESIFDNLSPYLREVPGRLDKLPNGLWGQLDQSGNKVYDMMINGNVDKTATGKFAGNITDMRVDGFSYTLTRKINGVEQPLVKIQKNADGKYDVWYQQDFNGPATMTFDDSKIAVGNVSSALTLDKVFSNNIQHIEELAGMFGARGILRDQRVIGRNEEQSPADRPDLAYRVKYDFGGADQLLPQNKRSVMLEVNNDESEYNFFGPDGIKVSYVKKVGELFEVRANNGDLVATHTNPEEALKHADLIAAEGNSLKTLLGDTNKSTEDARKELTLFRERDLGKLVIGPVNAPRPDRDGGLRREAEAEFDNVGNRKLSLVGYTNNQKAGRYTAGSRFDFLRLDFYNREENPSPNRRPVINAVVTRTGRSEWTAKVTYEDGRYDYAVVRNNDPLTAVDKLKEILTRKGILNDDVKFDDIVPKRTKDATGNDQQNYAGRPATVVPTPVREQLEEQFGRQPDDLAVAPIDVDRADKIVQRIVGNTPEIGNTPANRIGRLGGGINAPITITLPNGKKVKIKNYASGRWNNAPGSGEERLNINEAAVQGLADLMGVNATPGGLAKVNGKYVIMDPIADNVVPNVGWQSIFRPSEVGKAKNAQAIEDYKNAVVFNALVAGGDLLHHPANFLLLENPDGTRRLAICDGGRALIGGAYYAEPVNDKWSEPVSRVMAGKYHNDFMRPGARLEMRAGAPGNGVVTKEDFIRIARERVLPLTPEVIAKMGQIYQNPDDRRNFVDGLIRRRRELLQYLGIDENQPVANDAQQAPEPQATPEPAQAPATPAPATPAPAVPQADAPEASRDRIFDGIQIGNDLRILASGTYAPGHNYSLFADGAGNKAATLIKPGPDLKSVGGLIKTREDGSVIAVMNPGFLGLNENRDVEMAIFRGSAAEEDAQKWLSNAMHQKVGADGEAKNLFAADREADRNNLSPAGQPSVAPNVIKRGYLNPTSARQRMFARRLVEGKKMSDADRAQYRGVLAMNGLTTGEVGGIIDAIKNNEDRSASEIARSVAEDHLVPANEVVNVPSDLAQPSKPKGPAKRVIDLVQGDKIEVGTVAFIHDKGNGLVDVGAITPEGKLSIVRGLDGNLMVTVRPDSNAGNNQMVGGNNAVNNFAGRANRTLQDIKRAYPNFQPLPNGDIVIGQRDFTDAAGRKTRYEAVVHRTADETFVGYVRQLKLDPNGNIISTRAAGFTAPAHSSVAALNRLPSLFNGDGGAGSGMNGNQPNNWFNNLQSVPEAIDPRTGHLLPTYLIPDRNARLIGNTGIETTGDGLKDALVAHVANLIDRGVLTDDILQQVAGAGDENFAVLSRHQFMDIIERIEARRANPGVNAIPYVSKDKKTIVRVGDRVHHYDANGNQIPGRVGTVIAREPLRVYQKAQGTYEYRDILTIKWDGNPRPRPIAARRLEVIARADGSDPIPAINEPAAAPQAPQAPVAPQAPQAPAVNNNPDNLPVNNLGGRNLIQRENADGSVEFVDVDNGETVVRVRASQVDAPGGPLTLWVAEDANGNQIANAPTKGRAVARAEAVLQGELDALEAPAAPAQERDEETIDERVISMDEVVNVDIDGKTFRGRSNINGSSMTFYDESGNEAATIKRGEDGTYRISEPFGGKVDNAQSYRDALDIAKSMMSDNVALGLHDDSEPEEPSAPTPQDPIRVDNAVMALSQEIRGVSFTATRENDNMIVTKDANGTQGSTIFKNGDGTWTVYDPTVPGGEAARSEEEAVLIANAINFNNIRSGYHQPAPAEPSAPALPNGYSNVPVGSGNNAYEVKHDTDKENTPYYLVEKDADGNWNVSKWDSQSTAEAQRFRRPVGEQQFASKEEADQWIAGDLGPSDGGDGGNGGGGNPPNNNPDGTQPVADINEWVAENYGALSIDETEQKVIGSYSQPTPRLVRILKMKSAFEGGFTDDNPAGFVRGINPTRRVRLSDGSFAYLKNLSGGDARDEAFKELASARMFEAMGLDSHAITTVIDPSNGKLSVLSLEVPNDGIGHRYPGDSSQLNNGIKIALFDYLASNYDRHNGNWLFKGDEAFPIDHGLSHGFRDVPTELDRVPNIGAFGPVLQQWIRSRGARPEGKAISQGEFMNIREKILNLRAMYEAAGMGPYFNDIIVPRLDLLLGIWR
jgi:hypothetical protein